MSKLTYREKKSCSGMQALQSQEQQPEKETEIYLHIMFIIIASLYHIINLLCVNSNENKESIRHLNREAINLVVKMKVHLIPKILRVTFDILNIL